MTKKVKPIPDGYHSITPFLSVKECAKAIKFYKEAFGAQEIEKHNAPDGRIMHAVLKIGNSLFMLADEFPESGCGIAAPVSLKGTTTMFHIYTEDVDTLFAKATKAGAKVTRALENTFWGDRYGQVQDPFGHAWSLSTHIADFSAEEIEKKGSECMQKSAKK